MENSQTLIIITLGLFLLWLVTLKAYFDTDKLYKKNLSNDETFKEIFSYWKKALEPLILKAKANHHNQNISKPLIRRKKLRRHPLRKSAKTIIPKYKFFKDRLDSQRARIILNEKQIMELKDLLVNDREVIQELIDQNREVLKAIETLTERALIHEEEIADNFANKQEKPDKIKWIKRGSLTMSVNDFDKIQGGLYQLDQLMNLEDFCDVYIFTPEKVQIRKFDGEYIILKVVLSEVPPKNTRIFPLDFFKESN